jgi:hypothetical protein
MWSCLYSLFWTPHENSGALRYRAPLEPVEKAKAAAEEVLAGRQVGDKLHQVRIIYPAFYILLVTHGILCEN